MLTRHQPTAQRARVVHAPVVRPDGPRKRVDVLERDQACFFVVGRHVRWQKGIAPRCEEHDDPTKDATEHAARDRGHMLGQKE
jgi:hypothetical protein